MIPFRACVRLASDEAGCAGEPWRSVLAQVSRWAGFRIRNEDGDLYFLLAAMVEQRSAEDVLRAAGWTA